MASEGKPNRHYLLCPVCLKTQPTLSVHLRRVCMKHSPPEDIEADVEKAKQDTFELLSVGRVFTYGLLRTILDDADPLSRLIEELQRRHLAVSGIPAPLPNEDVIATPSAAPSTSATPPPPESAADETEESGQSDGASVSSGEIFQCEPDVQYKNQTRKLMAEKGLYKKHALDHPLLKDFGTHLRVDLNNENYKQEVENVARVLYYMDPKAPSLEFVRSREKMEQYMCELSEAKLTKQTQQNYLKSLKRFLKYHTIHTNLRRDDEALYGDCRHFIDYIGSLQACCSRQVSQEIAQKRHEMLTEGPPLQPHECWAVLDAAKKDFLGIMGKFCDNRSAVLQLTECGFVVYYLQAVVILKHLQRPGVVEHMTVREWHSRQTDKSGSGKAVVGVKEHKTAAQQVDMFALTPEEEFWFDTYYTRVRPQLLNSKKRKRDDEDGDEERFFISTTGRPIYNASNDLNRLHAKYNLMPVTSQLARRVFETAVKPRQNGEKSLMADYLNHSNSTANEHYREKQTPYVVLASELIEDVARQSRGGSPGEGCSHSVRGAARDTSLGATNAQMDVQAAFDELLKAHPVSLDGSVPSRAERDHVSPDHQRQLYERWLKAQMRLRVKHALAHFGRRMPKESRVSAWIQRRGWKSNIPSAATIVREWKPTGSVDADMDCQTIQKLTTSQKWKGLLVVDIEGKGKGVVATRRFEAGDVICDYHGKVITAREGEHIHKNTSEEETDYMFFYKNSKGQHMCIDAHSPQCECHPEKQTVGRLINHSRAGANLRPRLYTFDQDGEEKDVILFLALRDIDVNEELLFDYGVGKKSLRGGVQGRVLQVSSP